ncbi:MAG TPA: hypothetical protein VK851_07980 [Anaerolineales bacterium]|nr:hypothetical protein [Anaerolineales bacterium]
MSNSDQADVQLRTPIQKWGWAILSGIIGMFVGAGVGGPLLFAVGPSTIFNEAIQSPKVSAVWGELEPLPLMVSNPLAFAIVLAVLGAVHGYVFVLVIRSLPDTTLKRGLYFGFIIWLMSILYFELQAPYSMLGEPLILVGVELAIGLVGALVEGVVISWIYGKLST